MGHPTEIAFDRNQPLRTTTSNHMMALQFGDTFRDHFTDISARALKQTESGAESAGSHCRFCWRGRLHDNQFADSRLIQ
jgi:hypothetical protein